MHIEGNIVHVNKTPAVRSNTSLSSRQIATGGNHTKYFFCNNIIFTLIHSQGDRLQVLNTSDGTKTKEDNGVLQYWKRKKKRRRIKKWHLCMSSETFVENGQMVEVFQCGHVISSGKSKHTRGMVCWNTIGEL